MRHIYMIVFCSLFSTLLSSRSYLVLFSAINIVSTSDGARQISLSEGSTSTIVEDDNAKRMSEAMAIKLSPAKC